MIEVDSEATVNPIYILLKHWWHCEGGCKHEGDEIPGTDGEEVDVCELPCNPHNGECPFNDAYERHYDEHAMAVFLTREEAEQYGMSQQHNLGEMNVGWIVWCVPSMGELAKFLNTIRKVRYDRC